MRRLEPGHRAILEALDRHGVDFIVIGGIALQIHGTTHITNDVDITVATHDANQRHIAAAITELRGRPLLPGPIGTTFQTPHGRLDVLSDTDGVGRYQAWAQRAQIERIDGLHVRVGHPDDILRAKEATDRDKDRQLLPRLRAELMTAGRLSYRQLRGPIDRSGPASIRRPGFLVDTLGDRPAPARPAALWDNAARQIIEYRERWTITDPDHALGPTPQTDDQHADRRALKRSLDRARALIARALEPPDHGRTR